MYVCIDVHMYVCVCVFVCLCVCIHTYIHLYIYMYICTYVCTYMYPAMLRRYRLTQKADDTAEIVRKRIASYRSMQVGTV